MWLAGKLRQQEQEARTPADLGVTAISRGTTSVVSRGELRDLPVMGPGGFAWRPQSGAAVLLVRGGTGGEECCVAGVEDPESAGLEPGDVLIHAPGASIRLRGGEIHIQGKLFINGVEFKQVSLGG